MAQALQSALLGAWVRRGPLAWALLPVSLLYAGIIWLRRWGYRAGIFPSHRLPCAVVVVGNAVAGGAGKTPTTIGIVQHLRARGLAVGVVSRGYGRSSETVHAVQPHDDAALTGDEPLLIARHTGVPVFVGPDRHAAATALLGSHPEVQVIVCDDGLQHYKLHRDLEVCVFDERGVGNGWLLPAGPLREPWPPSPLRAAGQDSQRLLVLNTSGRHAVPGFVAQRSLSMQARTHSGQTVPLANLQSPLLALAGIAKPAAFFTALQGAGVVLDRTLPLPDHCDFATLDTGLLNGYTVLCTEKDAVKLWRVWPQALAVPLEQVAEPAFLHALDRQLDGVLQAKLSFPHGHQTT